MPYTYYQCPCTSNLPETRRKGDIGSAENEDEGDGEDDRTFDPKAPRSNYSLYPLDHLLYCEDCQQIRCPRCVLDEIVTWYCPNCLFEVPSSTVKTEGNKCTRSCFQCPVCISPLSVNSLETFASSSLLGSEHATQTGPYVLSCSYCNWSSKEIGIQFEKSNSIFSQLSRIKNGGEVIVPLKERRDRVEGRRNMSAQVIFEGKEDEDKTEKDDDMDIETRYANLKSFYQSQLADNSSTGYSTFTADYGYGSPGALARIMGLYTGGSYADKKSKSKTSLMREAYDSSEGLHLPPNEVNIIRKMQLDGWDGITSQEQRSNQPGSPRFVSGLRPVPYLLRTKRSKRCKICRHILSKPEAKVQTARYRLRLVALNYIPTMVVKPLSTLSQLPGVAPPPLMPMKPTQFLLTMRNPLYDPVKVTLATPSHTPGRFSSKITILCPQFEIGANGDVWDEALQDSGEKEKRRTMREIGEGQGQAEAGKVWEKGRNWVSVVFEVVPASLSLAAGMSTLKKASEGEGTANDEIDLEDEDLLEIPVFVRLEWESDPAADEAGTGAAKDKVAKEKKELAYWVVLGVGRIAQG